MDHPNIDLVLRLYGAFTAGDLDTIGEAMAPDVEWHNSGRGPTSGTLRGIPAVLDFLGGEDHVEDYEMEVVDVLASDARVAVVARTSGRRGEVSIVNDYVQLITVTEGVVTEVKNYYWDQQALEDFLAVPL